MSPELLPYSHAAVALTLRFPMIALAGMRTVESIVLFVPAMRLNGTLKVT